MPAARPWPSASGSACRRKRKRGLEQALAIARERRTYLEVEAGLVAALAEACLGAGDVVRARALADESVALGQRVGAPLYFFPALRALAHVLLAEADAGAAPAIRDALSEADRIIAETGATTLAPLVLLDRAELARLEGDTAARRRLLEEARKHFAAVGAPMRVQQIDALLAGAQAMGTSETRASAAPHAASRIRRA